MKIRELTDIKTMNKSAPVERHQPAPPPIKTFAAELTDVNKENYRQYFSDLTDKIHKQGARLIEKPDIYELQKYRLLISEFMREAVRFTYKYDRESMLDNKGRQKVYANIKKIDENLEDLARALISEQSESIDIVSIVDEICGLVIDMFL